MSLERLRRYYGSGRVVALREWAILLAAIALPLAPTDASAQDVPTTQATWVSEAGFASYYGNRHQGRRTASGARFDQRKLTAAHPWLPFGTKVRVTALETGKAVIVTITDRLYSQAPGDRPVRRRGADAGDDARRRDAGQTRARLTQHPADVA